MNLFQSIAVLVAAAAFAGCTTRGFHYTPVVDLKGGDPAAYLADVKDCQKRVGDGWMTAYKTGGTPGVNAWLASAGTGNTGGATAGAVAGAVGGGVVAGSTAGAATGAGVGMLVGQGFAIANELDALDNHVRRCIVGKGYSVIG